MRESGTRRRDRKPGSQKVEGQKAEAGRELFAPGSGFMNFEEPRTLR